MEKSKQIVWNRLGELRRAYRNYQNNPYVPETAHQLRVQTRKLRALLNFVKKELGEETYANLNGLLRETAQKYEPVRELDVLLEVCGEIALEQPEQSLHYRELFRYLDKERRKEMRRTFNVSNVRLIESTFDTVQQYLEHWQPEEGWEKKLGNRLEKRMKKLQKRMDQLDLEDYQSVHKTRIQAKKVRYVADDFGELLTKKAKKIRKEAEAIQDQLGRYTDLHVNIGLLEGYADQVEVENVKELLHLMIEQQKERKQNFEV